MIRRLLQRTLVGFSELALAVVLVLVFAAAFMAILVLSFPKGTALMSFYGEWVDSSGDRGRLELQRGDEPDELAVLAEVTRSVRERPAAAVAWKRARAGVALEDQHTIQTLGGSTAEIAFAGRASLHLGENSLVVIKRQTDTAARQRRASLVMLGGRVRGSVTPSGGAAESVEIVTAAGATRLRSKGDAPAEFSVTVNSDRSSTLSVFAGSAEVTAGGRTARLAPNQSLRFESDRPLGEPVEIPSPPRPLTPPDGGVEALGPTASRVVFQWSDEPRVDGYRLEVARDPAFETVAFRGDVAATDFAHGGLDAGSYHWRVSALRAGAASEPSPVRQFEVVEDREPPPLRVELPDGVVHDRTLTLRGSTEPGTEVFVGEQSVPIEADGGFSHELELRPGVNMIVVEAVDHAGNSAYHTRYITAKLDETEETLR